jgi:hypothetical protein
MSDRAVTRKVSVPVVEVLPPRFDANALFAGSTLDLGEMSVQN